MNALPSVITFTSGDYNLAVDSSFVEHLTSGTKKANHSSRNDLFVGLYETNEEIKVIEFFEEQVIGSTSPIIILRIPGKNQKVALKTTRIRTLKHQVDIRQIPTYAHDTSQIFNQAFSSDSTIHFLVDALALEKLFPEATNLKTDEEAATNKASDRLQLKLNSNNWLTYSLSILNAQKRSGQLKLLSKDGDGLINLTSGHPTYASHDTDFGISALQSIASSTEWTGYKWITKENNLAPNISESYEQILSELRKDSRLCST